MTQLNWQTATVLALRREAPETVTVVFRPERPLAYEAGQYVMVRFRFGTVALVRAYSLSSAPHESEYRLTVRETIGGRISQHINRSLRVGERFRISGALGDFCASRLAPEDVPRPWVCVAGGAGITPLFSLIKNSRLQQPGRPIRLLHYHRHADQVIFRHELEALTAHADFRQTPLFTKTAGDEAATPISVERVLAEAAGLERPLFWLCGSENLVDTLQIGLVGEGIPETDIHVEHFVMNAQRTAPRSLVPQKLRFARRRLLLGRAHWRTQQNAGESVLTAALRAGIPVPHSCGQGHCGSCRLVLRHGRVEQDEPNCLTPGDARHGQILACVAHAQTPCEFDIPR
ncbi:MAG: iron-sulfur cluster-binding domain-containing protein [Moraxellaceae bacterium]|nr:iron-sulfur cluster-binding domain-containing protein [Moraxellaceae bacterium]